MNKKELGEIVELTSKTVNLAHKCGLVTDDIVDKDENGFKLYNGKDCSMLEKFEEDLIDFIFFYSKNVRGSTELCSKCDRPLRTPMWVMGKSNPVCFVECGCKEK